MPLLAALAWVLAGCSSPAAGPGRPSLSQAQMLADFDVLRTTLEEVHPGLYWYSEPPDLHTYFDSVRASLPAYADKADFLRRLLPLVARIRCVHTSMRFPPGDSSASQMLRYLLPFDFYCAQGRLFIRRSWRGADLAGAEVLSIDDIPTHDIFRRLLAGIPADGYNTTYPYQLLSQGLFREAYALFFEQQPHYSLQLLPTGAPQPRTITVEAIGPDQLPAPPPAPPVFRLVRQGALATLSVNSFAMDAARFRDSVAHLFSTLEREHIEGLIIDLRQNGGGAQDNIATLYRYIAERPFRRLARTEMRNAPITHAAYIAFPPAYTPPADSATGEEVRLVDHLYSGTGISPPAVSHRFGGRVVLLTSGRTLSAAAEFAALARTQGRALIIGEETGGGFYGANGGSYLLLQLPHSGLQVRIPTTRIFTDATTDLQRQPPGRGTLPDQIVVPTIEDILSGRDPQLERAMAVIGGGLKH